MSEYESMLDTKSMPTMKKLVDPHGRHIHKLRISLLDACNFRCLYCMPNNPKFMPSSQWLSRAEILRISSILVDLGIDEIRITGGEPSLRADFLEIVKDLSQLSLKKLAMTTNGLHLDKHLAVLAQTHCRYINVSLDSLDMDNFFAITKSKKFHEVIESILLAKKSGFSLKINVVLMKGINDNEVERFVDFSARHQIEVRFLELMRIGQACMDFEKYFISAGEIIQRLEKRFTLTRESRSIDSTSFNYSLDNQAKIGFIASESRPFCAGCSRLRLSARGELRPCLMKNTGVSLKEKNMEEIEEILLRVMALKPIGRIYDVAQPMNQIGG